MQEGRQTQPHQTRRLGHGRWDKGTGAHLDLILLHRGQRVISVATDPLVYRQQEKVPPRTVTQQPSLLQYPRKVSMPGHAACALGVQRQEHQNRIRHWTDACPV